MSISIYLCDRGKMMKKIIELIFNPFKALARIPIADKIVAFFDKRPYMIYVAATFITLAFIFFKYIFPTF